MYSRQSQSLSLSDSVDKPACFGLYALGAQVKGKANVHTRQTTTAASCLLYMQISTMISRMQLRQRQPHAETLEGRAEVSRVRVVCLALGIARVQKLKWPKTTFFAKALRT